MCDMLISIIHHRITTAFHRFLWQSRMAVFRYQGQGAQSYDEMYNSFKPGNSEVDPLVLQMSMCDYDYLLWSLYSTPPVFFYKKKRYFDLKRTLIDEDIFLHIYVIRKNKKGNIVILYVFFNFRTLSAIILDTLKSITSKIAKQ